jgi:hypothetical protein
LSKNATGRVTSSDKPLVAGSNPAAATFCIFSSFFNFRVRHLFRLQTGPRVSVAIQPRKDILRTHVSNPFIELKAGVPNNSRFSMTDTYVPNLSVSH